MASEFKCEGLPKRLPSPLQGAAGKIHLGNNTDNALCDVYVTIYADRAMVTVTETGTFGCIVQTSKETPLRGGVTYSTQIILGDRSDLFPELCARRLIEQMDVKGCTVPLVLCVGVSKSTLKCGHRMLLDQIVTGIMGLDVWKK